MNSNIYLYGKSKELMQFGAQELPVNKEIQSLDWVIFGVTRDKWDNQYPQYTDYLSKTSTKNSAILKAKNRYVFGKGLEIDATGLDQLGQLPALLFIDKITKSKILPKIISDGNKHNGFAAEIIVDKSGKKITAHYLPFKNIRVSKDEYEKDEKTLKPKRYFYTKDWSKKGQAPAQNKDFVIFEPFTWDAKIDKSKRYIVYYKNEEYSEEFYPLPDYIGAIPYISADSEIGNFVDKNTKNGFSAGYLINFYDGVPTDEQKKIISDKIDAKLAGTDNGGTTIKGWQDKDTKGVEITPLAANGQDDRYNNLNNTIRIETFTGHCTPVAAVEIPPAANGMTNNADQDRVAIEKWTEAWVIPNQEPYNEFVNALMNFNGIPGKVHLKRLDPIKPQLTSADYIANHTRSEIRSIFGSPVEKVEPEITQKLKELNIKFSAEQDLKIIQAFESCGINDSEYHCFSSQDLYATDTFDAQNQAQFMRQQFASKIQNAIVKILNGDPKISKTDLAELIGEPPASLSDILAEMEVDGLLEGTTPTDKANKQTEENEIIAVYKYKKRDDVPPLETESRPFCKELMRLSKTKSWTIEQIQQISNQVGYDVFARRGGWYHNPSTGKNTPFCRHIWETRLVRKG